MVEVNSKLKNNQGNENPILKNEWFKGGRENNLDVFRSEGVIKYYFLTNI